MGNVRLISKIEKQMLYKIIEIFYKESIWRIMTNFWTLIIFAFIVINFLAEGKYDYLNSAFSVLYSGLLAIYVGTKEFDRWYEKHLGRHPGEWFVIFWTVLILILFGLSIFSGKPYHLSPDIVAVYITVLTLFAITQKSKQIYRTKKKP